MAKRQPFIAGSTNPITNKTLTTEQMNLLWNRLAVLKSDVLNGTFFQQSTYTYDSSNEIANALERFGFTLDADNNSQLADLLQQIQDTSLVFKGFVSTTEPSSTTYTLVQGNLWINSATMPTTFPVPASEIKVWDGTAWVDSTEEYTPFTLDIWRDINTNNGYYWVGGSWVIMSTDMSTLYFQLDAAGKWEIKNSIQLPGSPTIETMGTTALSIPSKQYVDTAVSDGTAGIGFFPGYIGTYAGHNTPAGWLPCEGALVLQTIYSDLYNAIENDWNPNQWYAWKSTASVIVYTYTATGAANLVAMMPDGTQSPLKTTAGSATSITLDSVVYTRDATDDKTAVAVLCAWTSAGNVIYTELPQPTAGATVWTITDEVLTSDSTVTSYAVASNTIVVNGTTYTRNIAQDDKRWFYLPDTPQIVIGGRAPLYTRQLSFQSGTYLVTANTGNASLLTMPSVGATTGTQRGVLSLRDAYADLSATSGAAFNLIIKY